MSKQFLLLRESENNFLSDDDSTKRFDRLLQILHRILGAKSQTSLLMINITETLSKLWPIKLFKEQYVLHGLLFMKTN